MGLDLIALQPNLSEPDAIWTTNFPEIRASYV